MQKGSEKARVKLTISIPQSDKKIQEDFGEAEEIYVKPLYSVQHAKKGNTRLHLDGQRIRDKKSKKLQRENGMLLKTLDVLKVGAISAIAEKQEQIDNLRSHIACDDLTQLDQQMEWLREQKQHLQQQVEELRQQVEELQQKLQLQRQSYMQLVEEKDRVIEQLYVELGSTQIQIEKLEKFQEIKEKKIKIIEEQNDYLFHQLQEEKIAHIQQAHHPATQPHSFQTLQPPPTNQPTYQDHTQTQKLLESRHREELNQLTVFYEKRLAEMRSIYQKQLHLWPTEHAKQNSTNNQLMEDVASLKPTVTPVPHKLSHELNANMKMLSDCYSMTKRDGLSKCDKSSIEGSDKNPMDFNFKFLKRVANTPASQTTSSRKVEEGLKFMVGEARKRQETEISQDRKSGKPADESKPNISFTSFVLGALTGGSAAFILTNILRR